MKQPWWKSSVVYQIYPRSFNDSNGDGIGDLRGITQKLDYLKELGIEIIWLSPIYKSPNADNGYDVADYQGIMDEFGRMSDFDELLTEAHKHGLRIMLDLVVNHSSDEHAWFIESRKSKDNPYRDYYIWKSGKENGDPPTNWGAAWGDSAWKYDEATGEYYLHLFHEKQPDLNWENPTLRQEVYKMMAWWLDKGVDGFRMDVINFISKDQRYPDGKVSDGGLRFGDGGPYFLNGPRIHEFLHEMNQEVLSRYDIITVGEMPGVDIELAKKYTAEDRHELDMVFHFEHVSLGDGKYGKWSPGPWKLTDLKRIFTTWQNGLEKEGWNSLYWMNHDQPRAVSRWGNDSPEYREKSAKMIATCLHMLKGTPYVYQGEEFGMTNVHFEDIKDYRDVESLNAYRNFTEGGYLTHDEIMHAIHERGRDNSRTPVQWDDSENAGFTLGTPWIKVNPNYKEINAKEALKNPDSIFYYYKKLIQLRKENAVITDGKYDLILEDDVKIYAYTKTLGDEKWLVICNFSANTVPFDIPEDLAFESKQLVIANMAVDEEQDIRHFDLSPYEARVYKLK